MDDGELGAVLCALAGPRRGDRVGSVGGPALAVRAVLAAADAHATVEERARVVLTGSDEEDARTAASRLAPGGRLVGLAADERSAVALVRSLGLALRHVEPLPGRVAWSAVSPVSA